jgi:hypothetical protein
MEMQLRSHFGARRAPDWVAAVVAGFAASAVLMVLELAWAASAGTTGAWGTTRMVAAITMGPDVLQFTGFNVGAATMALLTHYILGIFSGLAISLVIAAVNGDRSPGTMQAIGAAFGALIYLVNFHVLTAAFPWFVELRGWSTFVGHLVFGMALTFFYWKLAHPTPLRRH